MEQHRRNDDLFLTEVIKADRWILASLMQKAIRRNDLHTALNAGSSLWTIDKNSFWRRLHTVAVEDIGIGDIPAVTECLTIYSQRSSRKTGDDLSAGLACIRMLCNAVKSRIGDELFLMIERGAAHHRQRIEYPLMATGQLREIVQSDAKLGDKALALWLIAGTDRFPSDFLAKRKGDRLAVEETISSLDAPQSLKDVCLTTCYRTQWPLVLLQCLICQETQPVRSVATVKTESFAACPALDGISCYALDMFTRLGKYCIRLLMSEVRELRDFKTSQIGKALFYLEGGLTDQYLSAPMLDDIRCGGELAEFHAEGMSVPEYLGLRDVLKHHLAHLNVIRKRELKRYLADFKAGLI